MIDRLSLANAFEAAGIARKAAELVAGEILDAIRENVATKADLAEARGDLKTDLAEVRSDLKADLFEVRSGFKADLAELRGDLRQTELRLQGAIDAVGANLALVEHRLLTRLGALIVVVAGLVFAALRWLPH